MHTKLTKLAATLATAALAVAMAGCSANSAGAGGASSGASDKNITLAQIPGWNDNLDMNSLFKYVLDKNGYNVKLQDLTEISTLYAGTARGDIDAFSGAPTTIHKQYFDKFKTQLDDPGAYYKNSALYIAVPSYVTDVNSLADLKAHASEFNGTIVGIEPGSGLVTDTQTKVFPDYGLNGSYQLLTSSTTAMLAELKKSVDAKKPIAVTIWSPYWPNATYKLKRLADPKNSYGGSYSLHPVANKKFLEANPSIAKMMKDFKLTNDQFNTLDGVVTNDAKNVYDQKVIAAWFEKNPQVLKQLEGDLKG